MLAPANENERTRAEAGGEDQGGPGEGRARLRCLIADSQYSSGKVRCLVEHTVIPYTANQRGGDVLRVDRWFRAHGPAERVEEYRRRPAVEALFAFVKNQYGWQSTG